MRIVLPWPDKKLFPNNKNGRGWKYSVDAKVKSKDDAWKAALAGGLHEMDADYARLTLTFHSPDKRRRDMDNIIAACKASIDGISQAMKLDDSCFEFTFRWGEVVKGGAVVVEISPVDKLELVPFKT